MVLLADNGFHDIIFALLFLVYTALMVWTSIIAFTEGDLSRLGNTSSVLGENFERLRSSGDYIIFILATLGALVVAVLWIALLRLLTTIVI